MRISYGWVQGSGYNARTGNSESICPGGAKRPNSHKKKKKKKNLGNRGPGVHQAAESQEYIRKQMFKSY